MNRRHFLSSLVTAVAGFTILPPATTYQRVWRVAPAPLRPSPSSLIFYANTHGIWAMLEAVRLNTVPRPAPLHLQEMCDLIYKVKTQRERQRQFVRTFFFNESCPRD